MMRKKHVFAQHDPAAVPTRKMRVPHQKQSIDVTPDRLCYTGLT